MFYDDTTSDTRVVQDTISNILPGGFLEWHYKNLPMQYTEISLCFTI